MPLRWDSLRWRNDLSMITWPQWGKSSANTAFWHKKYEPQPWYTLYQNYGSSLAETARSRTKETYVSLASCFTTCRVRSHPHISKNKSTRMGALIFGGDGEIRTRVRFDPQTDFESASLWPLRYVSVFYILPTKKGLPIITRESPDGQCILPLKNFVQNRS